MSADSTTSEKPHPSQVTMSLAEAITIGQTMQRSGLLRDAESFIGRSWRQNHVSPRRFTFWELS